MYYVSLALDQRTRATLFLDESLAQRYFCSSALKWANMLALRSAIVLAQRLANIYLC